MKKVGWSSILVATLVLAFGVTAEAQQPTKIPRIGYLVVRFLCHGPHRGIPPRSARAWVRGGKNIVIE